MTDGSVQKEQKKIDEKSLIVEDALDTKENRDFNRSIK
jgi:hypothetical protein